MSQKSYLIVGIAIAIIIIGGAVFTAKKIFTKTTGATPTPTQSSVPQLTTDEQPKVSLIFSADGHYVTVNMVNLHAAAFEYNLIYDAVVKGNKINTGVSASQKLDGKTEYSKSQLLGSESSGHFTYHADISNATLELTLRDASGRSVFDATYPFTVSAGKSSDLQPQQ